MPADTVITRDLIRLVRGRFVLDWGGIHGGGHWARVRTNGLRLAAATGADTRVVEYFAFLHDSQRQNDGTDPEHGARAAEFAESVRGLVVHLDDDGFALLAAACRGHSDGLTEADVTVQTCWDADRLDLGRIGVEPNAQYLCTAAARDKAVIRWAYRRSMGLRSW